MLKIVKPPKNFGTYSEVSQENPLRWRLCLLKDGTLIPQSSWWKCKDFLNDVVIYLRTGKVFSVYSFHNEQKINDEGGYMALKAVHASFDKNLPILNKYLTSKGFPALSLVDHDKGEGTEKVVLIPTIYWQNTFYISYITALIRSCCFTECKTIEELAEQEEKTEGDWFKKIDSLFNTKLTLKMNELVYLNYQYSSKTGYDKTYAIHNAGMQTWFESYKQSPGVLT
jgi:hypothetical protein